jgi:hypothetical protein
MAARGCFEKRLCECREQHVAEAGCFKQVVQSQLRQPNSLLCNSSLLAVQIETHEGSENLSHENLQTL